MDKLKEASLEVFDGCIGIAVQLPRASLQFVFMSLSYAVVERSKTDNACEFCCWAGDRWVPLEAEWPVDPVTGEELNPSAAVVEINLWVHTKNINGPMDEIRLKRLEDAYHEMGRALNCILGAHFLPNSSNLSFYVLERNFPKVMAYICNGFRFAEISESTLRETGEIFSLG